MLERISVTDWNGNFNVPDLAREAMSNDISQKTPNVGTNFVVPSEGSVTLEEKWGLRRLVVRLERIDVTETFQKIN